MERLLKLVHSKAAEERSAEETSLSTDKKSTDAKVIREKENEKNEVKVICESENEKNDVKGIRETKNDKKETELTSLTEKNNVKVKDKIEKDAMVLFEPDKEVETSQTTESAEKFETFGNTGSQKKQEKANAKTFENQRNYAENKTETKPKIDKEAIGDQTTHEGERCVEAKIKGAKVTKLTPEVAGTKAETNVNCQVAKDASVDEERKRDKICIGKNETSEDSDDDTDVCESDVVFEDEASLRRVVKRVGSTGQDFFEKAYPILYEPLGSCSSIYDPSRGVSYDPFCPDFGPKTNSSVGSSSIPDLSEITLCDGEARGKGFKRLKDYLKGNQDFQEYSDYIFVENMYKAEDESPAATTTSLKVLFCLFNKIFSRFHSDFGHIFRSHILIVEPLSWQNSD